MATNKLVRLWAGWVPAMGVLHPVGRSSGTPYRTPLNIFPTPDQFAVLLPYGTNTQWLKNLEAAGHARLQHYGNTLHVSEPRIVTKPEAAALVERRWRFIVAKAPFSEALILHAAEHSQDNLRSA